MSEKNETSILSSRFQVLDMPVRHPGSCLTCGSHNKPVVDFGVTYSSPKLCALYICIECIADAANVVAVVTGRKDAEAESTSRSLKTLLTEQGLVAIKKEDYDNLQFGFTYLSGSFESTVFLGDAGEQEDSDGVDEDSGSDDEQLDDFSGLFDSDAGKSTEPVSEITF